MSCYNHEDNEKSQIDCSVFDYKNGFLIHSNQLIKPTATVIKYKKNDLYNPVDTFKLNIEKCMLQNGEVYCINHFDFYTNFDYQVVLNDTMRFFFTDITNEVIRYSGAFMNKTIYECRILSYKLNGILMKEHELNINVD